MRAPPAQLIGIANFGTIKGREVLENVLDTIPPDPAAPSNTKSVFSDKGG